MKFERLKKYAYSLAIAVVLVMFAGIASTSLVQAQGRYRDYDRWEDRQERRDRWEDSRERREEWRERELMRERAERERLRREREYGYGNNGYYGGNSAYNNEVRKGYSDGFNRGQEDARDRRSFNPNNSSHYRNGNSAYRDGFRQGYNQGYRQYSGYRRW